jgi:hypothetical protein
MASVARLVPVPLADVPGAGRYPLPSAFDGTGINPNTQF